MDPQKAENSGQATDSKEDNSRAGHTSAATSTPPPAYDQVIELAEPSCPPEPVDNIVIPATISQDDPITQQPTGRLADDDTLPPATVRYTEEMEDFIEDDRRCDCDKTDSCRKCGEQCDINCNEAFLCSGECAAKEIKTKMLIAPFWIFCNMKTLIPCVKIFKDHETLDELNADPRKNDVMREARDIILKTAPLWMSKKFELIWAGWMCMILLACTICNIVMVSTDTIFILSSWVIFALTLAGFFAWIGLLAFLLYRKFKKASVQPARPRRRRNVVHNQQDVSVSNRRPVGRLILFQLISEVCLYPQIILSLRIGELNRAIITSIALSLFTLLTVWILRIVVCNAYKLHLHNLFAWVIFTTIGSYLQVISLLVGLFLLAFNNESSYYTDIVVPVVMALTPSLNYLMFYIGYMYDIMLHAAALVRSNTDENEQPALELFAKLQDLPTFHKTFLSMSHYWSGTIAYFWMIPSVLLALVMLFQYDDGLIDMVIVTSIYFGLSVIIHHRAVLVSMSAHFMVACICGFVFSLCAYCAGVLMAVISIGLFILAAHIVMFISACMKSSASAVERQEELDNWAHRSRMNALNSGRYY